MLLSESAAVGRGRWAFAAAAVGVLLLAVGLRVHGLGGRSLWSDEYLSLECSSGWGRTDLQVAESHAAAPDLVGLADARPWACVWRAVARDENHPPLYFLILRAWREAFGDSAVALRSLSVVASVGAVAATIAAGVELGRPAAGLWAGVLMAVAVPQVREAQDVRAYPAVTLAGTVALLAVVGIARRGPNRWRVGGLFVALLVLPLLHYMALATVGVVAVYGVAGLRGPARRAVLGATAAAMGTYAACWGPHLLGQHRQMLAATEWLADPAAGHARRTLANLLTAPLRLIIDPIPSASPAVVAIGLLAILTPPAVAWAGRGGPARPAPAAGRGGRAVPARSPSCPATPGRPPLSLLWLWVVVPVAVACVIDLATRRQSLSLVKYTLAGAPGLYLTVGLVAASGRRLAWVPVAALAAACVPFLGDVYHPDEPDWRPLAQAVAERTGPADPVVLMARGHADGMAGLRVVGLLYGLAAAHRDVYVLDGPPTGPALAALRRARRACVIGSGLDPATVRRWLPGLTVTRPEMFVGLAVIGTADRTARPAVAAVR